MANTPTPTVKHWTIRGLKVQNVMTDGTMVPWNDVARVELAVTPGRISRAIRHLRKQGLNAERPRTYYLSKRYAVINDDLVVVASSGFSSTYVGVFQRPGSSINGHEMGQKIIAAIKADIAGTSPVLDSLTA
jgi:hypothetical protein